MENKFLDELSQISSVSMYGEQELNDYNKTLYHYTSDIGLLGIISSNRLHATSALFLNDSNEIQYGLKLIQEILSDIARMEKKSLATFIAEAIVSRKNIFTSKDDVFDTYIACFSEHKDMLSQWKGFSNQGSGYSIGFDSTQLKHNYRSESFDAVPIRKVVYSFNKQEDIVLEEINKCMRLAEKYKIELNKDQNSLNKIIDMLCFNLVKISTCFKGAAFSEEAEWRAVFTLSRIFPQETVKIKYKTNESIIPYLELDLSPKHSTSPSEKLPINEIVIGPKVDYESNKLSITKLLNQNGFNNVLISKSGINLR